MNRPSRPVRALASAVAVGSLLATGACASGGSASGKVSLSPAAKRPPSPSATPALTGAGAKAALITAADIEGDWTPANDAATWRDTLLVDKVDVASFLKAKTDAADCQRLLDSLYSDSLLGRAPGASALTGFTSPHARLLYQVGDYGQDSLTKSLDWLRTLPDKCSQFTATGSDGSKRTVQVVDASLPAAGDARQGITVTVHGTAHEEPTTLAVDVAAFRVGASGGTVTNGGPSGVQHTSTETAVREGARRLADVLAGRTPTANPSTFD
jgi:hypothetical protein